MAKGIWNARSVQEVSTKLHEHFTKCCLRTAFSQSHNPLLIPVDNCFSLIPVDNCFSLIPVDNRFSLILVDNRFSLIPVDNRFSLIPVDNRFSLIRVDNRFSLIPAALKGRQGMSDVIFLSGISELSFPISSLVFFCLVLLLFLCCHFSADGPFS